MTYSPSAPCRTPSDDDGLSSGSRAGAREKGDTCKPRGLPRRRRRAVGGEDGGASCPEPIPHFLQRTRGSSSGAFAVRWMVGSAQRITGWRRGLHSLWKNVVSVEAPLHLVAA